MAAPTSTGFRSLYRFRSGCLFCSSPYLFPDPDASTDGTQESVPVKFHRRENTDNPKSRRGFCPSPAFLWKYISEEAGSLPASEIRDACTDGTAASLPVYSLYADNPVYPCRFTVEGFLPVKAAGYPEIPEHAFRYPLGYALHRQSGRKKRVVLHTDRRL